MPRRSRKIDRTKTFASYFEEISPDTNISDKINVEKNSSADQMISLCWSEKNGIRPEDVSKCQKITYIFYCNKCDHEMEKSYASFMQNQECFYCTGRKLCDSDACDLCESKSFLSYLPPTIRWSEKNVLLPRNIFKGSGTNYIFVCNKCKHSFEASPKNISNGFGCPFCGNQKLCFNETCKTCKNKSFALHPNSIYLSVDNGISARQIFWGSGKKYKFDCNICHHSFYMEVRSVTRGSFCPYCSNMILCENSKCETCIEKSFASNPLCKYWSNENKKSPSQVFKYSCTKYKFICPECEQIYEATLGSISYGSWCYCVHNKTEAKLFDFLKSNLSVDVQTQAKFDWCKNKRHLPFDFLIEKFKIIIENDGRQHFLQIENWDRPDDTQKRDIYKMKCANFHNYSVIRISQEDVWNDKNNWQINLMDCIKKYDIPTNIYIGNKYNRPYTKFGSTYPLANNLVINRILCVSARIDDIIGNVYYRTIIDNKKINYMHIGKFQIMLLNNPYFLESLVSFIRYKNKKKRIQNKQY